MGKFDKPKHGVEYGVLLAQLNINDMNDGDNAVVQTRNTVYIVQKIDGNAFASKPGGKLIRVVNSELVVDHGIHTTLYTTTPIEYIRLGKENQCMKLSASSDELEQLKTEMDVKNRVKEAIADTEEMVKEAISRFMAWIKTNNLGDLVSNEKSDLTTEEKDMLKKLITAIIEGSSKINDEALIAALKENDVKTVVNWARENL